jgi:hypothetical protein
MTVIIEVKGNWTRQLYREIEAQLAGSYLRDNRCRHGLYLVGWFNCPQWDEEDPRRRIAMRRDPGETMNKLEVKALKLSKEELQVKALIINAALR